MINGKIKLIWWCDTYFKQNKENQNTNDKEQNSYCIYHLLLNEIKYQVGGIGISVPKPPKKSNNWQQFYMPQVEKNHLSCIKLGLVDMHPIIRERVAYPNVWNT